MKKLLPLMATFLLAASGCAQTPTVTAVQAPAQPLSLQEAVRIGLEKNPTLKAGDACAQAVHRGITAARSFRYPRADFAEGFTRGNNPVYVFGTLLTQRQFAAPNFALGFLNTPPPLDNFRAAFTATQPAAQLGYGHSGPPTTDRNMQPKPMASAFDGHPRRGPDCVA